MDNMDLILGEVRVLRAENREDINKLHDKMNQIHEQTIKTNGRVTKLEAQQNDCPGKKAMEKINKDDAKDSKQYKIGAFMLNLVLSVTIIKTLEMFFTSK